MSNRKLFVGGLAWATDNDRLAAAFEEFGEVEDARVITDRDTGKSRGFGFVTMGTSDAAGEALAALNETMLDGRNIRISEAHDRGDRGDRSRGNRDQGGETAGDGGRGGMSTPIKRRRR